VQVEVEIDAEVEVETGSLVLPFHYSDLCPGLPLMLDRPVHPFPGA
jgi:hypothetical protein